MMLCIDCKHHAPNGDPERALCMRPQAPIRVQSRVTGQWSEYPIAPRPCQIERNELCDEGGRFFESVK